MKTMGYLTALRIVVVVMKALLLQLPMIASILASIGSLASSKPTHPGEVAPSVYRLDVSHLYGLDVESIASGLREKWPPHPPQQPQPGSLTSWQCAQVDVSHLHLGDQGLHRIWVALSAKLPVPSTSSLSPATSPTSTSTTSARIGRSLYLEARMNRLSPAGVTILLESLLAQQFPDVSPNGTMTTTTTTPKDVRVQCHGLDLGWNPLHDDDELGTSAGDQRRFLQTLQRLLAHPVSCPRIIRLDQCGLGPATARALARGLMDRHAGHRQPRTRQPESMAGANDAPSSPQVPPPLSLYLTGNSALGDAGTAALAAALVTIADQRQEEATRRAAMQKNPVTYKQQLDVTDSSETPVLETLDLSACDIGDTGAEAWAVALENCPAGTVAHLDLSNNRLTDMGAGALARALLACPTENSPVLQSLDLSHNELVGDGAAKLLALAMQRGKLSKLVLRSCRIGADGASSIGQSLRAWALEGGPPRKSVEVDLSGNPLGVLRSKKKDKDGQYSASRLKSTATATAASYMNQGLSFLRKGLKDVGVDMSPLLGESTTESDDEEEKKERKNGVNTLLAGESNIDPSAARCGAKALSNAFAGVDGGPTRTKTSATSSRRQPGDADRYSILIGLRRCFLDHAASDALAAMLVEAQQQLSVDLRLDVSMNPVLEEDMVATLHADPEYESLLEEMAERHADVVAAMAQARRRALEAAKAAAARAEAEAAMNERWKSSRQQPEEDQEVENWYSDEYEEDDYDESER